MRFIYFGMCFFFAAVPREVADGTYNNMAALFRLSSFDSDVFKQKKKRKKRKQNEAPNPCMCHQITELAILEKKIRIKDKHKTRRQKRKKKITVKCRTGNRYPICHRPNDDTKKAAGFLFFKERPGTIFICIFIFLFFFIVAVVVVSIPDLEPTRAARDLTPDIHHALLLLLFVDRLHVCHVHEIELYTHLYTPLRAGCWREEGSAERRREKYYMPYLTGYENVARPRRSYSDDSNAKRPLRLIYIPGLAHARVPTYKYIVYLYT